MSVLYKISLTLLQALKSYPFFSEIILTAFTHTHTRARARARKHRERKRERNRQTDRQMDGRTDRQTEEQLPRSFKQWPGVAHIQAVVSTLPESYSLVGMCGFSHRCFVTICSGNGPDFFMTVQTVCVSRTHACVLFFL